MKGVTLTDFVTFNNVVSLRHALEKGFIGELGISRAYLDKIESGSPEFCNFFLKGNYLEVSVPTVDKN
ncbi:hypothetical protein [Gracilibacillus sp. Marseille-QA3620]